jgi:hypothetical protein
MLGIFYSADRSIRSATDPLKIWRISALDLQPVSCQVSLKGICLNLISAQPLKRFAAKKSAHLSFSDTPLPMPAVNQTSQLWAHLFRRDGKPEMGAYTILDGAAWEGLLPMIETHSPDYHCLFSGDLDEDVKEVSPYIVRLGANQPFTEWLLETIGNQPWGIFFRAPSTLKELRKHFRQFLIVKNPQGENLYFRFYDPRVLAAFLPTCDADQLGKMFGPVEEFIAPSETAALKCYRHFSGKLEVSPCQETAKEVYSRL